ncbi:hypothetical protein NQ318_011592 [Aromia moschata]|uniref:Uncharacterized protein n=1 Tax=Aromia moschata TaxID=1265417 RepID=A0AAV8Z6U6_9CUCU|nr:hypothetical protein NQ318_011592 [Aromia moschata]
MKRHTLKQFTENSTIHSETTSNKRKQMPHPRLYGTRTRHWFILASQEHPIALTPVAFSRNNPFYGLVISGTPLIPTHAITAIRI